MLGYNRRLYLFVGLLVLHLASCALLFVESRIDFASFIGVTTDRLSCLELAHPIVASAILLVVVESFVK